MIIDQKLDILIYYLIAFLIDNLINWWTDQLSTDCL